MIRLVVEVEERGEVLSVSYGAKEDETATEREAKKVDEIANAIQGWVAKKGGTGKFIAKRPPKRVTRLGLWDYFATHHDLHLLDSELNDIIVAVRQLKE